jgi:predicted small integral membrane protein
LHPANYDYRKGEFLTPEIFLNIVCLSNFTDYSTNYFFLLKNLPNISTTLTQIITPIIADKI